MFQSISYDDVMEWKIAGWELPMGVACIIRARNLENSKVTEHVYRRMSYAENKIRKYMNSQTHELIVCAEEALYYVHPKLLQEFDDDDE